MYNIDFATIECCNSFFSYGRNYVTFNCVVSAVREAFPNTDEARYTGFVNLGTDEGQALP